MLLAQSGSLEATNHVARQLRVRELTTEGTPNAQVVVDAQGILLSANLPARELFDIPVTDIGRALKDLELSYRPVDLRSPIDRVGRDHRTVSIQNVELKRADGSLGVFDVHVAPLNDDDGSLVGMAINFVDVSNQVEMRRDLDRLRQELQSSREELETTNEELQSTVEELETTNEELQSTNEELETLNEELESTNSELQSINNDLSSRTGEIERLNTLLLAITGNIEVGAAVLDRTGPVGSPLRRGGGQLVLRARHRPARREAEGARGGRSGWPSPSRRARGRGEDPEGASDPLPGRGAHAGRRRGCQRCGAGDGGAEA